MTLYSRTRFALHFSGKSTLENLRRRTSACYKSRSGITVYVSRPRAKGESKHLTY